MRKFTAVVVILSCLADSILPAGILAVEAAGDVSSSVSLSSGVEGAVVYIDGEEAGTTPLAEPLSLSPGTHVIKVMKEGFSTWRHEFLLSPGEALELEAVMVPLETSGAEPERPKKPLHKRWWFWALALAAAGALFSGGGGSDSGNVVVEGPNP